MHLVEIKNNYSTQFLIYFQFDTKFFFTLRIILFLSIWSLLIYSFQFYSYFCFSNIRFSSSIISSDLCFFVSFSVLYYLLLDYSSIFYYANNHLYWFPLSRVVLEYCKQPYPTQNQKLQPLIFENDIFCVNKEFSRIKKIRKQDVEYIP